MLNKAQTFASLIILLIAQSCSKPKENPEARMLLDTAQEQYDNGNYIEAIHTLDSLQKTFPAEIAIQREAMTLRPKAIEAESTEKISALDSAYNADIALLENLKPQLKWVKTPGMIEGYWIAPECYTPNFMNTTGIEARVSEIGEFYIVSSVNPAGNLHHQAITLNIGNNSAKTPAVAYDGESNYRIDGGEVITFSPEQSDSIGKLAMNAVKSGSTTPASIVFHGSKGQKNIKLSAKQIEGIAKAYTYSNATIRARDSQVERERLNRTIEIARRQYQQAQSKNESNR